MRGKNWKKLAGLPARRWCGGNTPSLNIGPIGKGIYPQISNLLFLVRVQVGLLIIKKIIVFIYSKFGNTKKVSYIV